MIRLFDRASMEHALTLDLDPKLYALLKARIDSLRTTDHDLADWTEFLIVSASDRESDIVRELAFSPLVEPIDGARYGGKGFHPFWDWLADHDGFFEMIVTFGSTFAYVLLVEDAPGADPELLQLCRRYASASACS